jgi:hypothetical protein
MMGLGGVLGEALQWIARIVPRVRHLECTDIGVFIKRGDRVRVLSPGMHIFWPIWTAFYSRPANVQTVKFPATAIEDMLVGGMCRYSFLRDEVSVHSALVGTDDVEASIVDEAAAVFCEYVTGRRPAAIRGNLKKANRKLTKKLSDRLQPFGVHVMRAQLTDFSQCVTLNHFGIPQAQAGDLDLP